MTVLWQPMQDAIAKTKLTAFQEYIAEKYDYRGSSYQTLHHWSIHQISEFWQSVWDICGVLSSEKDALAFVAGDKFQSAQFFPNARLNFAQNLLRKRDGSEAIVFRSENGKTHRITRQALYDSVSRLSQALRDAGVKPGDRVAAYLPNIPETVIAALATASVGAIWSSCSPDFGVKGVLDRFQQIEPKILIACDGYLFKGKSINILDKVRDVAKVLPTVECTVIIPFIQAVNSGFLNEAHIENSVLMEDFIAAFTAAEIDFEQLPFSHPLYIMFSSGTTGVPKCIVHGAGGTLLQHLKEHQLHCDIKSGDRVFYFTTCGWMMWNWLVSALASDATILLFDGSPMHPTEHCLFDYIDQENITHFGTSAKYIQSIDKAGLSPIASHDLSSLRQILSTGSPLFPDNFDYVYKQIKHDVCLSSISGGTDIISCFVLGNPNLPVYRGEIQSKGLGMAVDVWDENGNSVTNEKGELVCTLPFPSMPTGFWNDNGSRYQTAYFERFPDVWTHGDFAEQTHHGGLIIHGRSDATLNPGGIRIGTAEIYQQVEDFDEVLESVVIGQQWQNDIRIILFVVLRKNIELNTELIQRINQQIRTGASPRHTPAKIIQVQDIPRTRSGKITELAIRDAVHGRIINNIEALANPEALDCFRNRQELSE